jgi:adenine-specific DNA-methyltransferase
MKVYAALENALKKEPSYVAENGELKKWVVISKAREYDAELIANLLKDEDVKLNFFIKVEEVLIFKRDEFIWFLEQKNYLNDSYTAYRKLVGLNIDGKGLNQRNEIALSWPFKDCVLEGGQTREEDKREEIFFNEVFAQDEITQLFAPKVLANALRYTNGTSEILKKINRNESGDITDNFIVKGNNLLSLHSLKKQFAGKVKLIYIDPPYNTGSDSFNYNDSFNQSTWLTFMRNRLQVALELLREDGAIFVHIDHHQLGYLNVLMDEVFSKENKVQIISIKTASPAGFKTVNPGPIDVTEYILFYTKNKSKYKFKKGYVPVKYNKNYNLYLEKADDLTDWRFLPLKEKVILEAGFKNEAEAKKKYGTLWSSIIKVMMEDFAYKNANQVVSIRDPHKPTDKLRILMERSRHEQIVIAYEREDGSMMYLYRGGALAFYSNKMRLIDGQLQVTELLTDFWNHISWAGIAKEGGVKLKNGKKPEKLLKQILELTTEVGDLVLDYHLGSGTTAAVAHKMNRQYIGLEQLDYSENDSLERLKNVLAGDTSGISSAVKWTGGGEFIYFELKKYNQMFIDQIEKAKSSDDLLMIWDKMKEKSFLNYNVDIKKQDKYIEEFKSLSLSVQKNHLIKLLDRNQLYVNISSINDEDFALTNEDIQVTKDFYQLR